MLIESSEKDKDRNLKREEIAQKERANIRDNETALKNKVVGEKSTPKK